MEYLNIRKPQIIAVANQKGGVGKTTLAVSISACLTMRSKKVLLVDADQQGSSVDWYDLKDPDYCDFDVMEFPNGEIDKEFRKTAYNGYDYIIIDTRPTVSSFMAKVLIVADLVCVPMKVQPKDLWATEPMLSLIDMTQESQTESKRTTYKVILNCDKPRTNTSKKIKNTLKEKKILTFNSIIGDRTAFGDADVAGRTVVHGEDSKAMQEIEELTTEILLELK